MTPKDPVAETCGVLLSRGIATREVIAVAEQLRRIAEAGVAGEVELPQYQIRVRLLPPRGVPRKLYRPGRVS